MASYEFDATSDDERLALDMQLALDLQEAEEVSNQQRRSDDRSELHELGFATSMPRADHMLFVTCEVEGRLVQVQSRRVA
jgi:hypothetical protein